MLLTALALLGSISQSPAPAALPPAIAARDVRLVVQASSTHLVAENLGAAPQLLLFSEPAVGFRAARFLAPGERATFPLPDGLATTFRLEAFEGPWPVTRSTGTFGVDDVRAAAGDVFVAIADERGLSLRHVRGGADEAVETGPSLYPGVAHVPAPIPSADRRPATRRIEKRPLPPV